jgi:protein PhnA
MPDTLPPCPACNSEFAYDDGSGLLNCPECGHAWTPSETAEKVWKDANGNELQDGDTVTVIKDLKFRGGVVKVGTKVKNIKLVDGDHDIDCKVPGIGQMGLKTEFVKKISD